MEDYVAQYTCGRGFDVIYDTAGGATLDASFAAVRRFGHVVSALGWGMHALAPLSFKSASYSGVFTLLPLLSGRGARASWGHLAASHQTRRSGAVVAAGRSPRAYSLGALDDAYQAVAEGGLQGKAVIDIVAVTTRTLPAG